MFKSVEGESRGRFILNKAVWFVCTARNAIVVIICLVMSLILENNDFTKCQYVSKYSKYFLK